VQTILIVGATGVIGDASPAHFAAAPGWTTVAVSRRTPAALASGTFRHVAIDLRDASACLRAYRELSDVTHVVYTAVSEQPGLVPGWHDPRQMQTNYSMLQNLLDPLTGVANLRHVTLLQGAKAYGGHAGHRPPVPARESAPRVQHENFYWLQEDYLRGKANESSFTWTIFRPQVVVGAAWGAAMNPLLPLAAYAILRHEEGRPFSYPGGEMQLAEIVDASLLAKAFEWAGAAEQATNQIFNVTNGDVFAWRESWPVLADALGVEAGPDEPMKLADYLPARSDLWTAVVAREGLNPLGLMKFLGESHHYIDVLLRRGSDHIERPTLLSTIKLRQAGFGECEDSEDVIRRWIGEMRKRRLIPPLRRARAEA
jgi:nucleoside-diphosphate-sugar epimerase